MSQLVPRAPPAEPSGQTPRPEPVPRDDRARRIGTFAYLP